MAQSRTPASRPKPIELYYWPTPNGWKISIMLEECGLPYNVIPVNIAQGRPVQAGIPGDLAEQPDAGDRRSRRAGRPADLGLRVRRDPAISRAQDRQVLSARTSVPASRSTNGCSGRWPISGPRPARPTTSAATRRRSCPTRIERYTNEMNRLYGVMNRRLAGPRLLAGNYSIADMACVGWIRLFERQGEKEQSRVAGSRTSNAGSTRCGRGPPSSAGCISRSRRRAGSTCRTPRCAPCCLASAPGDAVGQFDRVHVLVLQMNATQPLRSALLAPDKAKLPL